MMSNFILVHQLDGNKVLVLNQDTIHHIKYNNDGKCLIVIDTQNIEFIIVNESVERVYNMLDKDKFIMFHSRESNLPVVVKKDVITCITVDNDSKDNSPVVILYFRQTVYKTISVQLAESVEKTFSLLQKKPGDKAENVQEKLNKPDIKQ